MSESKDELEIRFTHHAPKGSQAQRYTELRATAKAFAQMIIEMAPQSREQSLAITKLEEVVFWANAAIARRENVPVDQD